MDQMNMDLMRKYAEEIVHKALIAGTTGGGNVSGAAVIREDLQSIVKMVIPKDTPMRNRIPRMQGLGKAHSWAKLTSPGTGGGAFAEAGRPNTSDTILVQEVAAYKQVGNDLAVSDLMIAAGANFDDVIAQQRMVKIRKTFTDEENLIINGDSTNPLEFDGLIKQIVTNVNPLGGAITLSDINDSMADQYDAGGMPTSIVAGTRDKNTINKSLLNLQRFTNYDKKAGVAVQQLQTDYGDVDFIVSRYLAPDAITGESTMLLLDESSLLDDGENIQIREVIPLTSVSLGRTGTAYEEIIFEALVLAVLAETFCAKITGIQA